MDIQEYHAFLTEFHTGEFTSLKSVAAQYVDGEHGIEYDAVPDGTVEYTEADIEFERRRALQESMDRRN